MQNEIMLVIPEEIKELSLKVKADKQAEVSKVLNQIFTGTNDWENQVDAIVIKDINDKMSISLADAARKNAKQARLNAEKIFDAKRAEVQQAKSEYDLEDKLWLKAKQIMQLKFKSIEEKAEWKADCVKRYEAEQKELRTQLRIEKVSMFAPELNRFEFENMSNEMFDIFLSGIEKSYNDKIEAEQKAEAERLARIEAERLENERIRLENERLQKEAIERERLAKIEREKIEKEREIERKKQTEILAKQQAEAERLRKIEAEKQAKIQAELKAKAEAERKENERLQAELNAKLDAEKKAEFERLEKLAELKRLELAGDKERLTAWISSLTINEVNKAGLSLESTKIIVDILTKFERFKIWAKSEIEKI